MPQVPTVHFEAATTLAVVLSSNEPLLFLSDCIDTIFSGWNANSEAIRPLIPK